MRLCFQVASEYFKDTTLLLMGVICLAASIEKWNLHKRIALRMVMIAGAKPGMYVPPEQFHKQETFVTQKSEGEAPLNTSA